MRILLCAVQNHVSNFTGAYFAVHSFTIMCEISKVWTHFARRLNFDELWYDISSYDTLNLNEKDRVWCQLHTGNTRIAINAGGIMLPLALHWLNQMRLAGRLLPWML